jgi:hypothetical protein
VAQGFVVGGRLEVGVGFDIGTLVVVAGNAFVDIELAVGWIVGWVVGGLDREEERRNLELVLALGQRPVLVRLLSELFRFRLGRPF